MCRPNMILCIFSMFITLLASIAPACCTANDSSLLQNDENQENLVDAILSFNATCTQQNLEVQPLFFSFLNKVAGINTEKYNITRFRTLSTRVEGSEKIRTSVSATLASDQEELDIAMESSNGQITFFSLSPSNGSLMSSKLSIGDCLETAKKSIIAYKTLFNADYCTGLDSMLPEALTSSNLTLTSNGIEVNIQASSQNPQLRYLSIGWSQTIDGVAIRWLSVQLSVSETGIITSFADERGFYKVATTNISVSKERALEIAMPYVNEYASANDRTIAAINASLSYMRDSQGSRGDSTLVYPQWMVLSYFDNPANLDVYGYYVNLWADNGEVSGASIQGMYQPHSENPLNFFVYLFIITTAAVALLAIVLYVDKRRKTTNAGSTLGHGAGRITRLRKIKFCYEK